MLDDIRNVHPEEHWETLRRRWGALLSYRYIGRQFSSMNAVADDTVMLRHDLLRRLRCKSRSFIRC